MNLGSWWIIDVIGPVILLIVLISLILKFGFSNRNEALDHRSRKITREFATDEEQRRREGTDQL
jgi:hypothetical protein